jgi:hypothetical protein
MKALYRASFSVALFALVLGACSAQPDVQVVGDSVKVKAGEPLPRASALFDGKRLELRAARGETLGVQVLERHDSDSTLRLELPERIARVQAFELRTLEVREPSTAMYGESRGPGRYPDVLAPVKGAVRAGERAFFDVAVLPDAPPGRYAGTLSLGNRSFPVSLRVERVRIDVAEQPLVWVFYLPRELARAHGLADDDGPEEIALEERYVRLFREHGALLATHLGPERFAARQKFVHGVRFWPAAVDTTSDASIARDVRRWLELFQGSSVVPFTIPVDEPHTLPQKQRARHVADVIGQAGGKPPRFLRAVTDSVQPLYDGAIDLFFSPSDIPRVSDVQRRQGIAFWTYNGRPPSAGSMILDTSGVALRSWGWIAYRYGIDLWYAWEGLYFSDRYNRGGPTDVFHNATTFDERRRGGEDFGNGDGVLAYPGPLPSLRLKALRRGLQDRLLLLALEACGHRADAERMARRIVPRALGEADARASWPSDEPPWEAARQELFDALDKECPA